MENSKYGKILYFIGGVILITLCIQVYWNYRNYQQGKQQLVNEVQISLDNAVEKYFASGAQNSARVIIEKDFPSYQANVLIPAPKVKGKSSPEESPPINDAPVQGKSYQEMLAKDRNSFKNLQPIEVEVKPAHLDSLLNRIIFSVANDTLDLAKMDSLVKIELQRKEIKVNYGLLFVRQGKESQKINLEVLNQEPLKTESTSTWLPQNSSLALFFTNETAAILEANLMGILLSGLLMASVIGCLMFLLKIINDQKQLAEIKNDLISNITHEFKTPIATISVAMEGILNFNKTNDPEKTLQYSKEANLQVEKLNVMVEKLLETATLSGKTLPLRKEEVDLVLLLRTLTKKWQELAPHKNFQFKSNFETLVYLADPFHIENAFNNIFDNAVKYGGGKISTSLQVEKDDLNIIFSDTGTGLTKVQTNRIFDKFYRVPKGNTHDIKGFGIGLYYTRKIIEGHGGSIRAEATTETRFIIHLPWKQK